MTLSSRPTATIWNGKRRPDLDGCDENIIPLGRGRASDEAVGEVHLFCIPESDYVSRQTLTCSFDLDGF